MALTDSNTYIEPTAGTGLNTARGQQNNNFRSLLTNFASSVGPPVNTNLTASGDPLSPPNGMMYYDTNNSAMYVSDSSSTGGAFAGTNFTRRGISFRQEATIAAAMTNIAKYETGEAIHVVTGTAANTRLYLKMTAGGIINDVGISPDDSVTEAQIKDDAVSSPKTKFLGAAGIAATSIDTGNRGSLTTTHTLNLFGNAQNQLGNVGIVFNASNATSNVGLKVAQSVGTFPASGENAGLLVTANTGNDLAPIGANVILQSITGANAITDTASSQTVAPLVPVGSIIMWGGGTAPLGWAICDGAAIGRTSFAGLFAAIGTTFGVGNGSSTFNKPDFQDRLPLGKGTNNSTLGAETTGASASAVVATSSQAGSFVTLSPSQSVAASAKDSSTATVFKSGDITVAGHTHNLTVPSVVVNYIIKT